MLPIFQTTKNAAGEVTLAFALAGTDQLRIKIVRAVLFHIAATPIQNALLTESYELPSQHTEARDEYSKLIQYAIASTDFLGVEKQLFQMHEAELAAKRGELDQRIGTLQKQRQDVDAELGMSKELHFKGLYTQAVARMQSVLTKLVN